MSRQRTWFWIFASAEAALVLLLAATALSWSNGIGLLERYQAGDATVTLQQLDDIDSMVQLLSILAIVAIVVRLVTLIGWLHSCVRLIADEHLGALTHTPGWAIGAWFVPFLNLVRVPRIFMDVQAAGETRSRVLKEPSTVVIWWIAWVGLAIADRVLAAPTNGEGIEYIRRLSTEATQSTVTQLIEAVVTVPLVLGLTIALGRRLASARSERARLAAFPAPAVALDPSAYAGYPVPAPAPYAAPAPFATPAPYAPPAPPPTGAYPPAPAPTTDWAPPSEPGASAPLPGFAPPPSSPPPTGNAYYPLAPGAGAGPAPMPPAAPVVPVAPAEPQERVRILSDHEKAELATQPPSTTEAGWYDDPLHAGGRRYWNGAQWTGRVISGA